MTKEAVNGNHNKGMMMMIDNSNDKEAILASTPSKSKTKKGQRGGGTLFRRRRQRNPSTRCAASSCLSLFWFCILAIVPFSLFLSWHVGMNNSRQAMDFTTASSTSKNATDKAMLQEVVKNSNSFWSDMPTNAVLQFLLTNGNGSSNNNNSSSSSSGVLTMMSSAASTTGSHSMALLHQQQQQQTHSSPSYYQGQLLALLYPPGLMGGYRNQVIRFTSLCVYAHQNERDLFLPSLLWVTQVQEPPVLGVVVDNTSAAAAGTSDHQQQQQHNPWLPVPMQDIFDIEHWNSIASSKSSDNNNNPLPRIIAVESKDEPAAITARNHELTMSHNVSWLDSCWIYHRPDNDESSVHHRHHYPHSLQRAVWNRPGAGYLKGLYNETIAMIETFHRPATFVPRRTDFLPVVEQHCRQASSEQQLMVYGGGKMGGRLWSDAMGRRKSGLEKQQQQLQVNERGKNDTDMTTRFSTLLVQDEERAMMLTTPTNMDGWVVRALRPAPVWRAVADQCLVVVNNNTNDDDSSNSNSRHARRIPRFACTCGIGNDESSMWRNHGIQSNKDLVSSPRLARMVNTSSGCSSNIIIITTGYASSSLWQCFWHFDCRVSRRHGS
jgi:hypothetical protein